jgi:hypothetical protein
MKSQLVPVFWYVSGTRAYTQHYATKHVPFSGRVPFTHQKSPVDYSVVINAIGQALVTSCKKANPKVIVTLKSVTELPPIGNEKLSQAMSKSKACLLYL